MVQATGLVTGVLSIILLFIVCLSFALACFPDSLTICQWLTLVKSVAKPLLSGGLRCDGVGTVLPIAHPADDRVAGQFDRCVDCCILAVSEDNENGGGGLGPLDD